ncbi:MAG: AmmeMemoRadiSam system radical SAM enzyme [Promethearchaeota archaeon]
MKKEALLYERLEDGKVKCLTCGHECIIPEGKLGICGTRTNDNGKCYTLIYGALTARAMDPIEKKPLFHFYPGHYIFSTSSFGCSFKCKNCQNYDLSQTKAVPDKPLTFITYHGQTVKLDYTSPEDLISTIKSRKCELLAFTYNEPLIWLEYIIDVGKIARKNDIKIVLVSNGYSSPKALEKIIPYVDAANIDIKAFDQEFYKKICAVPDFTPVLHTIKELYKHGKLVEITNLIIPTLNDSEEIIKKLCTWIIENLDAEIPLHFSAYRPMFKMDVPSTPNSTLIKARDIANDVGLKHVYLGNVFIKGAEDTKCPKCEEIVIARRGYNINTLNIDDENKCKNCGYKLNIVGKAKTSGFKFF